MNRSQSTSSARRASMLADDGSQLVARYREVRQRSEALCRPLEIEDYGIQTTKEVSPPKWHLAHVSWFFETFLLLPYLTGYRVFHPQFHFLFNSYYETVGAPFPRPQRGLLSRPTVDEVYGYRAYVDDAMERLLSDPPTELLADIEQRTILGLHHEQQHQELLLTDIKHIFAFNPLRPHYIDAPVTGQRVSTPMGWLEYPGGVHEIGHDGPGFAFDNETPRHRQYLNDYRLADRLVTNGEFMAFIADDGYLRPELWLADGWSMNRAHDWQAPLYWEQQDDQWWHMTLNGMEPVAEADPVCHVSFYEADAYARWCGERLPSEAELELAACDQPVAGNFADSGAFRPLAAPAPLTGPRQLYGDVWEWTSTPYAPYPGFRPLSGSLGEYNGKFMSNQMVLRGGSCATPPAHMRPTYRNFFYPHERWQFMGLRLAGDR